MAKLTPVELLDNVFSNYVRLRDSDKYGFVCCCTCGKPRFYKDKMQCGHFQSRKHTSTRWDEKNTGPQCVSCNIFNQGRQVEFEKYLEKRYGKGTADLMLIKTRLVSKIGKFEIQQLTVYYEQQIEELLKTKNFTL